MNLSVEHVLLFALVVCAFYYLNRVEGVKSGSPKCPETKINTPWGTTGGHAGASDCGGIQMVPYYYIWDNKIGNNVKKTPTEQQAQDFCNAQYVDGALWGYNRCNGKVYMGRSSNGGDVWHCKERDGCDGRPL